MLDNIKSAFKDVLTTLQTAKMYGTGHPMFKKAVDKAYASLLEALQDRQELVFGIVGEELAFDKEIFFDLSKFSRPAIIYLKDRGVERIAFCRGVEKEELEKFIGFLCGPKDETKADSQERLALTGVRNITVGRLKVQLQQGMAQVKEIANSLSIYESSLDKVSQSLTDMLDTQSLDQMSLKFSMYNVIENMGTHYKEFLNLTTLKRLDVATYAHLLNVSILSMYFSSRLGLSKEDCLDIGIAALFHDIGKLYVSRKIIRKSEKLTEDEYGKLKSHPVLGSQILLKYVDSLGILPVVVCFEHHMKFDLSGYPKFPYTKKPHMASLIVSICDVYDALSQRRGYKRDYSPDLVHNIMAKDMTGNFDPQLIDRFFNVMGVWPIGSVVALSDGNIAIVRDENEDNIYYPKVEVIHPLEQRGLIDLKERKGSLKIERSLNPWKEGKFYLDQFSGQQKRV